MPFTGKCHVVVDGNDALSGEYWCENFQHELGPGGMTTTLKLRRLDPVNHWETGGRIGGGHIPRSVPLPPIVECKRCHHSNRYHDELGACTAPRTAGGVPGKCSCIGMELLDFQPSEKLNRHYTVGGGIPPEDFWLLTEEEKKKAEERERKLARRHAVGRLLQCLTQIAEKRDKADTDTVLTNLRNRLVSERVR